ncbi:MAG TPA: universal stress protein [Vicinamibacterales bacterium]|nr:universal stress protein [Vicinamibacterales bacterium]
MTAIQQILCPVDFSEFSRRALDHALGLARCYGSAVTALHVVAPAPVVVPVPYYFGAEVAPPMTLPPADRGRVASELEAFVSSERAGALRAATYVAEGPVVHQEILVQAKRLHADLIVLGTHGRSGFERLFLGSTAEKVLRTARCPVMTVPPHAPDVMPRGPAPFTRIVCAIDFSDCSQVALEYALSLARQSNATLTLVHVLDSRPLYVDFSPAAVIDLEAWTREARTRLHALVSDGDRTTCRVSEMVREGKAYREILRLADVLDTDLIVLGVRGRGATDLVIFGSTTHHVIRAARCAVLTVHA